MGEMNIRRMSEDDKLTDEISHLANESDKVRKTREKLKQRLENNQLEVTKEGLKKKIEEIHDRIARQTELRVFVKKGSLSLFDNNQNPARSSTRVAKYAEGILNSSLFKHDEPTPGSLKNRSIEAQ